MVLVMLVLLSGVFWWQQQNEITRIVADKRFQLYSIGIENNSYLGVSASESYKFTNIIEVTKALPLIIFHSIFNLDINILYLF